jgi:hypothetical protein
MTTKTKRDAELVRREIEHYDTIAGESVPEGATGVQRNRPRSVVYSLRLNPEDVAELERVAAELDVPATSLARGYVLQALAEHRDNNPAQLIHKIQGELGIVRGMLERSALAEGSKPRRGRAG